ncbi:Os02g0474601 [Oryza sativa Japonica Group]|uniref:Os02g0474601 protein n=1 Tax=Oryza sativa subsp. japonica TaxID=39947 RepID=A0A0P0VIX1_ORYSJ|nr:Os02g0474601 [Oryza sativa Japonica Group]
MGRPTPCVGGRPWQQLHLASARGDLSSLLSDSRGGLSPLLSDDGAVSLSGESGRRAGELGDTERRRTQARRPGFKQGWQ